MKHYPILLLLSAIFLSSCSGGSRSDLEEALSWAHGKELAFDNWAQINADFGWDRQEFLSRDWVPKGVDIYTGEMIPGEMEKDNLSLYANQLGNYAMVDSTVTGRLGFYYPDIRWEASSANVGIFKFESDYDTAPFEKLMKELEYKSETYRGYTVHHRKPDIDFFAQKNANAYSRYGAFCFSEDDNILLMAPELSQLKKTIDAHEDKKSFLEEEGMDDVIANLDAIQCVYIFPGSISLKSMLGRHGDPKSIEMLRSDLCRETGVTEAEFKALHRPKYIAVGEREGGEITGILLFADADHADADEDARTRILEKGRSFITNRPLNDIFFDFSTGTDGSCMVFGFYTKPAQDIMYSYIGQNDLPWAIAPG